MAPSTKFKTVDQYISSFFPDTQVILNKLRKVILTTVPKTAEETISYNIPTYKMNGKYVIYFAGFKNHISIYPIHRADKALLKESAPYIAGKGTLRFPIDKPLPVALIKKVVKALVKDNQARTKNPRS